MKLYYSDVLSPRKACALAKYLNSPVEFIYQDLGKGEHKTPEALKRNPNGKVPTLVDGDRILWEADAIMCELASRAKSELWPTDPRKQVEVIRWLSWQEQHFGVAGGTLYFEYIIRPRFNLGPASQPDVERGTNGFRQFGAVLNDHLRGKTWLLGNDMTLADFAVAVCLPYAEKAHMPLGEFPEMRRWHDQLNELDAWRNPFPVRAAA
ncbi:MAG TPA: glutathione S-transferase family protein [Rhizomicrobium sp.]|jgi:glutathione S-transferase